MNEAEAAVYNLPQDWPASLRARFAEGLALLQQTPVRATDLVRSIGVVGLSEDADQVWARYMLRADAIEKGEQDGFSDRQMRALRTPTSEGTIAVLFVVHRSSGAHQYALFTVPVRTVIVAVESGGSGDN
jgi:hypothetical protein